MKAVKLVGSSFNRVRSGVSNMNFIFFKYLSERMNVEKVDVADLASQHFGSMNLVLARNIELFSLGRSLSNQNIHVMHTIDLCNTIPLFNWSRVAKRKIITVHDFYHFVDASEKNGLESLYQHIMRHCYKFLSGYDHIFARTDEVARIIRDKFNIDKNKVSVQGPIIEYVNTKAEKRSDDGKVRIGYINSFSWNKAPMLLAFIEILRRMKDDSIELHIYGKDFPYADIINNDKKIKYYGFLPESRFVETMSSFDVYLSTSTHEGFGIPIAKAKGMKVPVLCYDGDIPAITKRNTVLWNEENLIDLIENRKWGRIDLEEALKDVKTLRPEYVVDQTLKVYDSTFD